MGLSTEEYITDLCSSLVIIHYDACYQRRTSKLCLWGESNGGHETDGIACIGAMGWTCSDGWHFSDYVPQPWLEGWGGGGTVACKNNIMLTMKPIQQQLDLECLYLVLGNHGTVGFLLVYCSPHCPTRSLLRLANLNLRGGTSIFTLRLGRINRPRTSWSPLQLWACNK